jgi:HlyD family secretion protein
VDDSTISGRPEQAAGTSRRILWGAGGVLLLALAGGLIAWWRLSGQVRYITAPVTRGDIVRSINMTGALNPVVTAQVGSYVSGNIKAWTCDYNTPVKVGQQCAQIDPLPFQVVVDEDAADLQSSRAQHLKDQAALANAKIVYERDKGLREQGIVSQQTVDGDKATFDQDTAQVALDRASIASKEAALHAAQVNLGYTHIVSPVEGMVITRYIDVGQTVVSNLQSSTLFLIGKDMRSMQVDTNVSEADVGEVHEGQRCYFTVQAFPARTFEGKVRQIRRGPITVQNVVTYDVVVDVKNDDLALYPGMTADAHIVTAERRNVLRVPLPATRFVPEGGARTGGRGGATAPALAGSASASTSASVSAPASATSRSASAETAARQDDTSEDHRGRHSGRARSQGDAGTADQPGSARAGARSPGAAGFNRGGARASRARPAFARLWVMREGTLVPVPVHTGLDDGTLIEVWSEELKSGDQVVVNAVRPSPPRPQAGGERPPGTAPGNTGRGGGGGFRL